MKKQYRSPGRHFKPAVIALFLLLTGFCGPGVVQGQDTILTSSQLEDIVAPVALYPDDLLTNVLTAATVPAEVTQAVQLLQASGGKVSSMPDNDWDPSVKALLSFPDVLNKMNSDPGWTQSLGNAVINQMNDVIAAVQSFRNKAMQAGNLQTNDQQKVVQDQNTIMIEPSTPDVYYVPQYEPSQVVYAGHPVAAFASGVAVANWWNYRNMNWANGTINVNPAYINHYNYRPGGNYYNNLYPRPGYTAANTWRPVATPYGTGNAYRAGNAYNAGNEVRTGNTVRAGNTYNINTGGNTANFDRNTANSLNTTRVNQSSLSTSNINAQLRQGFQQSPGGAFGGMSSGSSARYESARGASSRSSFQSSGFGGGSFNRGGGGFGGGRRR
ncbi:MAG: DUF3300 domain-containing protein [Candidatus Eremiobacteraeota bacterium]|nr:DUF3300 domain-containing protein [Candidatus Eremiobacteraeota bacterium]